jgi:heme/copper-type cytochrome/quinol oxidase subunit 2
MNEYEENINNTIILALSIISVILFIVLILFIVYFNYKYAEKIKLL